MHIALLTYGSTGDVLPFLTLGQALRRAGHRVRLATHEPYRAQAQAAGLDFHPVAGDPRLLLGTAQGRGLQGSGRNVLAYMRERSRLIGPLLEQGLRDTWTACAGVDLVVDKMVAAAGTQVAQRLGLPFVRARMNPTLRTTAFPSPLATPALRLPGPLNRATHLLSEQVLWQPFRDAINRWRRETLGEPALPLAGPLAWLARARAPQLFFHSPSLLPAPPDWGPNAHVTGYWYPEEPPGWAPPAALEAFLAKGEKPVFIGFGSMQPGRGAAVTRVVVEALAQEGLRGVLATGWGGLELPVAAPHVLGVDEVPHGWLFPRMAAVVHHGGAGVLHAALRAGVPSVTCPLFADQPFWAQVAWRRGVAPRPLPWGALSVAGLRGALREAVRGASLPGQAAALGERVRAEPGVQAAVACIEALGRGRAHV